MIEIHFYGLLRRYAQDPGCKSNCVVKLEPFSGETVASLLARLGVPVDEINHIFYNAKLLASRTKMASMMGFQQATSNLSDWNLDVPVDRGDRIGLFGADMALLGM